MFGNNKGESDGIGALLILVLVILPILTGIFGDDDDEVADVTTSVVIEEPVGTTDVEPVDSADKLGDTVDRIMTKVDSALQKAEEKIGEVVIDLEARQAENNREETISAPLPEGSSEEPILEDDNPFAISNGFEER